jgi:thiamine pyrophosphokinase
MIIGDSDSITAEDADFFRKRNVPFRSFPSGKDATDGEIALGIVVNEGYDEILVAGWGGGRTDHLLSNIAMLERYSKLARISFISRHERVEIIRGRNVIAGKTGATVSLLALTGRACVSLRGFEYPLTDEMIKRGSSRGVSNIIRSERAHVTVHSGTLLMIIQEEQE